MTRADNHHPPRGRRLVAALVLVLLFRYPFLVWAGDTTNAVVQYGVRTWEMEEALPQNMVQALAQTHEGYLWVGTPNGLARFDGARFKVFDSQNTPGLKNPSITALCEDRAGSLWIGSAGGGLTRMKDGQFTHYSLGHEPRGNEVRSISESRDGSLWIGTLAGLVHWVNGSLTYYDQKDGLLDNVVRSACEDNGEVWIGTGWGLNVLRNGMITHRSELKDLSIRVVMADHLGNLWVGWAGGLICVRNGQISYYTKEDGLADNHISALFEDRRGDLWVGTFGGLCRFAGGKFMIEKDDRGSFFDQINAIIEDKEGDIWVGGRDGLQELRARRFTTYTRDQGLPHNNVMSVLEDHQGGIWAGSWGGGLSRLADGQMINYNWENSQTNGLTTDLILSLCEDADGSILIGTDYEGGTFRFKEGSFTRIWSKEQAAVDRVIRVIYRDREGNLWFGASPGLVLWNTHEHFLKTSVIRCILEDDQGVLWVGTSEGLYFRKDGKFTRWSPQRGWWNAAVISLYEDREKNLWLGTMSHGLGRLRNGSFTAYTSKQGLFSDDIYEILEDNDGWLWMSCSKGVFRVNKKNLDEMDQHSTATLGCIAYGKSDGMESLQCSAVAKPGAWKGRDGRLWFATTKGLAVTDPSLNRDSNQLPPEVLIEEVMADKKLLPIPRPDSEVGELEVPAGRGDVEFHYTALSLQAPEKNRFKYKLEGIDSDWAEVTRRVAYYNNLRPGHYRFRVLASNQDGVWNETGATMKLRLLPHFWQTWWFASIAVVLMAAAAGGAVRYVTRRNLRRELRRLEQQHAIEQERTRIARDMHDEIGAKLTKISFLGAVAKRKLLLPEEAGQQIDRMSQTARDVIRALDEIVWAVNPANDSLEDLATYLCRNAAEFFADSPIACQFKIPPELPAFRLGTHVRHNILLAAKEALNNVLKHSGATHVRVQISDRAGLFEIMIADDGRGFSVEAAPPAANGGVHAQAPRVGDGLANMRHRLEAIGGECQVASRVGQGTSITFTVWLNGKPAETNTNGRARG